MPIKPTALIVLQRGREDVHGTRGVLLHENKMLCFTLEEPWKDNEPQVSCIPVGIYKVVRHGWEKDTTVHFKNVWRLLDVPGRQAILIHAGNTTEDTKGCILVGLGVSPNGITNSRAAIEKLRTELPEQFTLEVRYA